MGREGCVPEPAPYREIPLFRDVCGFCEKKPSLQALRIFREPHSVARL
jgi:hypothetical protein